MASKAEAREIIEEQSELESRRAGLDEIWQTVAEYCAPDAPDFGRYTSVRERKEAQAEREDRRQRKVYDTTIIGAVDRLCAGLESLITPQSEKWHGFGTSSLDDEETEEEKEWAESLRDFMFEIVRYQPSSNFEPSLQQVYKNIVRFGPAYLFPTEFPGRPGLIRYRSIPTAEGYIVRDDYGMPLRFHRCYRRTALQIARAHQQGYFKAPKKILDMADQAGKKHTEFTLIQAISPKPDGKRISLTGPDGRQFIDMPWQSVHVIEEEEEAIRESGFLSFPVATFSWEREEGDDYGTSPAIKALTTVREQNAVRKSGLRALQMNVDPVTLKHNDLDDIPTLNPGAHVPGAIADDGTPLLSAYNTGANPQFAYEYADKNALVIQAMMFTNLFQILVDDPQMTATQALLRNQEKGDLLGPVGSIVQSGFAQLTDRELAILEAQGLYAEGSRFLPPASLAGKEIKVNFTSPLDVLRRSAEASDTLEIVSVGMEWAKVAAASGDTETAAAITDRIDLEESLKVVHSAKRSPQRILRRDDEVAERRAARAAAQKNQAGMAAMQGMAQVAKDAAPALATLNEQRLLPAPTAVPVE